MDNDDQIETRQERRQKKLAKQKEHMPKHGKGFIRSYRDAILKRLRGRKENK